MNTNENNAATKNPTAATAAAAILAAANAATNNTATPTAAPVANNTATPTAAPTAPVANTATPIIPMVNAATPMPAPTIPMGAPATPIVPMATPVANTPTPTAAPEKNTAAPAAKNRYSAATEKAPMVEAFLSVLTDNNFSMEVIEKLMDDIDNILTTKRKDLSFEGPICNMADASVLFGEKQSEEKFKDPEKEALCKRLHNDLTGISKKLAAGVSLTPDESNLLLIIQIEFCKLMKFRNIYVGNAAWYFTKTKQDAGIQEVAHEDVFERCSVIYSALDIFDYNTDKVLALLHLFLKFDTPESARDIEYILESLMISHNMNNDQIVSAVFGDTGVMDRATKNKIAKICIRPGTLKFLDEVDLKPLTPIYRIADPLSDPNIASLVVPEHYYFTIGDTNTILDIDPIEETIKRIMVTEAKAVA